MSGNRPRRRVAVFVGNYVDVIDGVAKSVRRLVGHLREQGDEVRVFAPVGPHAALSPDDPVVRLPSVPVVGFSQKGYRLAHRLGVRARRQLDQFDPDVLHLASPDPAATSAMRWARRHGVPVVSSYHTHFPSYFAHLRGWNWFTPVCWGMTRRFYGRVDRVLVPTPSIVAELRANGVQTRSEIWSRGIDPERFSPEHRSEAWRAAHGIAPDDVVVAFVARLFWEKGVRDLAAALQRLEQMGTAHRVLIVGSGPAESFLRRELPDAIFPGFLRGGELSTAFASADLFCYPSQTDTFGNVTLEAMASGLPVVATDAPGTCDVVDAPRTGSLVPPGDAEGMAARLHELIADPDLRGEKRAAALARARSFTWASTLDRVSRCYDELISAGLPAPSRGAPKPSLASAA